MVAIGDVLYVEVVSEDEKEDGKNLLVSFNEEVDGTHGVQGKALTNIARHYLYSATTPNMEQKENLFLIKCPI